MIVSKNKQRGFSLIELLIVIVIAGIAIAVLGPRIAKSFGGSEANDELQNIQAILGSARELKGPTGYGANGTSLVEALNSKNAIPGSWTYSGGVLRNVWGGTVTITANNSGGFTITSAEVPAPACNSLAVRLSAGQTVRSTTIGSGPAITGPVTAAQAATGCGDPDDTVTMTWATNA